MKYFLMIWLFSVVAVIGILGPRGSMSRKPPHYLFPDMDWQAKAKPQAQSAFFEDNRVSRKPVAGTVIRGLSWEERELFSADYRWPVQDNPSLYSGRDLNGDFVEEFPIEVDEAFIRLGQEKYSINCAVCHGALGDGKGVLAADGSDYTMERGYFGNVANLTGAPYLEYPNGRIFHVITNGWNTMYPYADKLTPRERWAVIAYVRALQLAANASIDDAPEAIRKEEFGL